MTSYVTPKKNTAYKFYIGLIDQSNTKLLKANPTIAAGDFKVSTDGGAFANLATLPSANPASGRAIMIDFSAGEMNGDNIVLACVDAAGAEWCDLLVNIRTTARQIDDLAYPATTGRSMVVDAAGLVDANMVKAGPTGSGTAQTAGDIPARLPAALTANGNMKSSMVEILTTALTETAGQLAAAFKQFFNIATPAATMDHLILVDTVTTYTGNTKQTGDNYARLGAPAGASVSADIAAAKVDTAAIKTQTDKLTFTVANQIDANVLDWKSASAPAMTGDAFARLGAPAGASISADIALKLATATYIPPTTALTESYAALHAAPSEAQLLFEIRALLAEKSVAGTTLTAKKIDGATSAETFTLNDSAAPTSITRAS